MLLFYKINLVNVCIPTYLRFNVQKLQLRFTSQLVRRLCLTKVSMLRETVGLLFRRFIDIYREGYFKVIQNQLLAYRSHRFLYSACLISFAQDMISEEEMIATAEFFDVNKLNKTIDKTSPEKLSNPSEVSEYKPPEIKSLEGPITLHIRDIRKRFEKRRFVWLQNLHARLISVPTREDISINTLPKAPKINLSNVVGHLQTDGTNFIDNSWELILNTPELRMWRRRSLKHGLIVNNSNAKKSKNPSFLYDYRVCGTFEDVSGLCFLEVQLNLAYRRKWDSQIALLELIKSRNGTLDPFDQTEIIRWVANFPFPMAKREYIYARRWWADIYVQDPFHIPTPSLQSYPLFSKNGLALISSRAATPDPSPVDNALPNNPNNKLSASILTPFSNNVVAVTTYESNLLIRSHDSFDKPGLDYFLTYTDDPKLSVSQETASWISCNIIPKFMKQLHRATIQLTKNGLPVGVLPVAMPLSMTNLDSGSDADDTESDCSFKFFSDYPPNTFYQLFIS